MPTDQFHIEKHVHGGLGLSHDPDGKATLLEGVIAGERVTAKIYSKSSSMQKGRATQVNDPSPSRIQPPCKIYKHCGGCDFQHMSYSRQLLAKEEVLQDLLLRSNYPTLIRAAKKILAFPIASDEEYHYRQRIRLQVDPQQTLGFYKRRSNVCVAVSTCLLAQPQINDCLHKLQQQKPFSHLLARTESLELLFNPADKQITLIMHLSQKPRPADMSHAIKLTKEIAGLQHVFFCGVGFASSGQSVLSFSVPPLIPYTNTEINLSWETGGFCQVNLKQNIKLIQTVLEYCNATETDSVLDLFCGNGNFSIPLAILAKNLFGVEGQGSAIRSARKNSTDAGQTNTSFSKQNVHDACISMANTGKHFDIVIIDPPRQGVPGLAEHLTQLTNKRLIYVSCDPATLCRDLAKLIEKGFHLTKLQPIDMFPQTHHIECVALLEKVP